MSGDNTSGSLSTSPSDDEGDFTPVTYKKPPRAPKHRKGRPRPRERTLIERLSFRRANLEKSDYLALCETLLREALASKEKPEDVSSCPTPVCVVCLGLGSIADSNKSQDQYVLMQNLLEDLKPSSDRKPTIYDPVFTEEDYEVFRADGIEILLNEHDLAFDATTLLYMPHCPRSLFNDLFRKNWSVESLRRLVILGNRLDMYDDPAHPSATLSAKAPFVAKIVPLFKIVPLPPDSNHFDVFNDLALQWIPEERLMAQPEEFWRYEGAISGEVGEVRGSSIRGRRGSRGSDDG